MLAGRLLKNKTVSLNVYCAFLYEILLLKAGNVTVNVTKILCVEIYATIKNINPQFMNEIFKLKQNKRLVREKYKLSLKNPKWNQVTFGEKCFKVFGAKVWNNLPYYIKSSQNIEMFKSMIKQRNGSSCKCLICDR